MKYFKVSFEYSENVYCTNIAVAECKEDVEKHYSKYSWVSVKDAEDWEVEEAKRKGMPIVTVEHAEPEQAAEQETDGPHIYGTTLYGNEVSEYGQKYGYVDYAALAKSFNAVLNNDIMSATAGAGFYWDPVSGYDEDEDGNLPEIFQWYIVDDEGAKILEWAGEIVFYNQELDMYIWGVTHYGTAWSHVLTNIKCNTGRW